MSAKLQVRGLRELQAALRKLDPALPKQIKLVLDEQMGIIVGAARRDIPVRSGRAARSIKARSGQREGRIAAGGRAAPWYPFLDFGGSVGRDKSTKRPYYSEGRYLYPALRTHHDDLQAALDAGLARLAADAGLELS